MIRRASLILATTLLASAGGALAQTALPLPRVPMPQSVTRAAGVFQLADGATIGAVAGDAGATTAARVLAQEVKRARPDAADRERRSGGDPFRPRCDGRR